VGSVVGFAAVLGLLSYALVALTGTGQVGSAQGEAAAATSLTALIAPEKPAQGAAPAPAERLAKHVLDNGCSYSSRGIPKCGVLLGAAYGANSEPLQWEQSMRHPLGVRRTYWDAAEVAVAVSTARRDLQSQRLPWMSFKLPYSWEDMRDGRGDDWVRELARQLSELNGPVWLAFHHEPEGDGDVRAWTAMQARLAPIVRAAAPNVGYSIILTGWNQLYGDSQYSFNSIWPDGTKIDIAGFDVYDKYGVERGGARIQDATDFEGHYFAEFRRFAEHHDVAWALAETGHTDHSAEVRPDWVLRTYLSLLRYDGVALTYFNSTLNSIAPWYLTATEEQEFGKVLRMTPSL
jgi:hypothetical protein